MFVHQLHKIATYQEKTLITPPQWTAVALNATKT